MSIKYIKCIANYFKVAFFKITRSRIVLAGYTALNKRIRTYRYTKKSA